MLSNFGNYVSRSFHSQEGNQAINQIVFWKHSYYYIVFYLHYSNICLIMNLGLSYIVWNKIIRQLNSNMILPIRAYVTPANGETGWGRGERSP